jgi:adenylosuccinate synthase
MALGRKFPDSTIEAGEKMLSMVWSFMLSAHESNKSIIVKGAKARVLSVNYSSYSLIISSHITLGSIIGALTLNSKNITATIGAVKASKACVGPGDLHDRISWVFETMLYDIGLGWGTPSCGRRRCG